MADVKILFRLCTRAKKLNVMKNDFLLLLKKSLRAQQRDALEMFEKWNSEYDKKVETGPDKAVAEYAGCFSVKHNALVWRTLWQQE